MRWRNTISYICLVMMLCLALLTSAADVYATGKIDVKRDSSLTLQYSYEGSYINDIEIDVYYLAVVDEDGVFTLNDAFSGYGIDVNNVSSQSKWNEIASTFAAYAIADSINADYSAVTNSNGLTSFNGLKPGMYLTREVSTKLGEKVVRFENFITVIPHVDPNDEYNYNVTAYPKAEAYIPESDDVKYNVIKLWKDNGHEEIRLSEIKIEILKDNKHISYEILNEENNWSYSWDAKDDGSTWNVVELSKTDDYKASITKKGNTFTITNTFVGEDGKNKDTNEPKTGDMVSIWPYIMGMCFSGILMMLFSVWRKREE